MSPTGLRHVASDDKPAAANFADFADFVSMDEELQQDSSTKKPMQTPEGREGGRQLGKLQAQPEGEDQHSEFGGLDEVRRARIQMFDKKSFFVKNLF